MTARLEQAFEQAARLPEPEQDALANLLMEELKSQEKWSEMFASSQESLAAIAENALREFEAGKTQVMDLERDFPHD